MSLGSENCAAPLSAADVAAVTGNNGNNGWGGGFGEMLIAMIMLFLFPMFFGGFGGGMWGGMGGWGNGGMMAAANGALTRADLCSEFNFNGLENAVRGVTQGLCDGFYAMQNSIMSKYSSRRNRVFNQINAWIADGSITGGLVPSPPPVNPPNENSPGGIGGNLSPEAYGVKDMIYIMNGNMIKVDSNFPMGRMYVEVSPGIWVPLGIGGDRE